MKTIIIFCFMLSISLAARVGVLYLELANSQVLFNKRIAETLAKDGHEVTLIVMKCLKQFSKTENAAAIKHHILDISGNLTVQQIQNIQAAIIFEDLPIWDTRGFKALNKMTKMLTDACERMLQKKEAIEYFKKEQFDVVITHAYDSCSVGVLYEAGVKSWIWLNSGGLMEHVGYSVGQPYFPSFMPPRGMNAGARMNFIERTKSFLGHVITRVMYPRKLLNAETALFRKYVRPDFPDLFTEVGPTAPLVMVNSNELYEQAAPTLHKIVNIGGIGMQFNDGKPLPEEYTKLIAPKKGVFLMSFGSVANATLMPLAWKHSFMQAFARFPEYLFVMRYSENDMDSYKPANVLLKAWIPQTDLLKHEKTIGFITHGGYNSIQESILAATPLIAIALFGDQFKNSQSARQLGLGLVVSKSELSADSLSDAIQELTQNPQYTKTATRLSQMAARKPIKPEELLNKWVTFLAEFKTIETLVPESQSLNFIQYYSLDTIAFVTTILFGTLAIVFLLLRMLFYQLVKLICRTFGLCNKAEKQKSA